MNAKRVNGAAGVILAALTQNRTPAGIALALESAGLLMTPETAADMASVSTDAVRIAEKAVEELRREHAESARLRARLAEQVVAPAPAPGAFRIVVDLENADDYEDAVYAAEQAQGALRGLGYQSVAVVDTEGERQLAALRARVAELETELARYVGKEPTVAEEMAYLSRCVQAVGALHLPEKLKVDSIHREYRNGYVHALADMREALEAPERASYPPALPWATLMDDEDLSDFLDELADAAGTPDTYQGALAEVEATCGRWRVIAEAQHAHNTAPGPDAEVSPDALTRVFAPTAALREDSAP